MFKFDHLEWAIEKSTELGAASITPVLARRTEKHLAQAAIKRVERWRRIVHEAAQQSRRVSVPVVADPVALKLALAADRSDVRILLSETEQSLSLSDALSDRQIGAPVGGTENAKASRTSLAIGPEGGWTADEMALFTEHRWTHVTLGPRILRAETAAIAAIAIAGTFLE